MILIVGGEGSGKRTFAMRLGFRQMADAKLDARPAVFHAERLAAEWTNDINGLAERLSKKAVVICSEVGSGIIPVKREDRDAREAAGRLCILLANKAEAVVRMVCGIPTVIKGRLDLDEGACL